MKLANRKNESTCPKCKTKKALIRSLWFSKHDDLSGFIYTCISCNFEKAEQLKNQFFKDNDELFTLLIQVTQLSNNENINASIGEKNIIIRIRQILNKDKSQIFTKKAPYHWESEVSEKV